MNNFIMNLSKIDRRHIQLLLAILSLGLFALGAGAPAHGGDVGL
jgi:hypothetical protein